MDLEGEDWVALLPPPSSSALGKQKATSTRKMKKIANIMEEIMANTLDTASFPDVSLF